jgi:hypothetical protein
MPVWMRTDCCLSVDNPEKPGKEADEKLDRLKSWLGRHMRTTRLTGHADRGRQRYTVHRLFSAAGAEGQISFPVLP